MEIVVIEKQALDELVYRLDSLKTKLDGLYANSGVAPQEWLSLEQVFTRLSIKRGHFNTFEIAECCLIRKRAEKRATSLKT